MHPDMEAHLMELKTRQKNLMARRVALEKKQKMRDATMAEFSVAYTDMLKRKQRQHQQNEMIARKRNQQFLSTLYEHRKSMGDPVKSSSTTAVALEKAKMEFANKVMEVYPAWQEELQRFKMQKLRQLEQEKHEIEYRRMLAKQSFEKEQGIDALLQQAANDINLVTSVERNETYERQLLRQQKLKKAMDLENAIHFHAEEERRRMEDAHFTTLTTPPVAEYEQLAVKYAATSAPPPKPQISFLDTEKPNLPPISPPAPLNSNDMKHIPASNTVDQGLALPPSSLLKVQDSSTSAEVNIPATSMAEQINEPTEFITTKLKEEDEMDDILNDFHQMVSSPPIQPEPVLLEMVEPEIIKGPAPAIAGEFTALEIPATDHSIMDKIVDEPKTLPCSDVPMKINQDFQESTEIAIAVDETLATIPCAVDMIKKPKTPSPRHSPELHPQATVAESFVEELNLNDGSQVLNSKQSPKQSHQDVSPRLFVKEDSPDLTSKQTTAPSEVIEEVDSIPDLESTTIPPSPELPVKNTEELILEVPTINEDDLAKAEKNADSSPPQTPVQPIEFGLPELSLSPPPNGELELSILPQSKAPLREPSPVRVAEAVMSNSAEIGPLQLQLEKNSEVISSVESPIPQRTSAFPESPTCSLNDSVEMKCMESPLPSPVHEEEVMGTPTAKLSDTERLSLMTKLMQRIEECAKEEGFTARDEKIELQSKLDLLKAAKSGRQAQINVYGADVCFALVLDGLRDIGPYLFTEDLMVGKMTTQRLNKAYQANRNKEKDYWKLFTNHLTQLITLHALSSADAAHVFSNAFMDQMPRDDRTARKLRELLLSLCPASDSKELSSEKPKEVVNNPGKEVSDESKVIKNAEEPYNEAKSILGLAFMKQTPSAKRVQDPIVGRGKSLSNTSIGQRVLRGASLRDYSDFEDDVDDVNYSSANTVNTFGGAKTSKPIQTKNTTNSQDDDFDENF